MADENKDQVQEEVKTDQSSEEQSEETKEEPITLEKVAELTKGLQKGYTLNSQGIAEIRDNISQIVNSLNQQSGAKSGDDEYLTVGKMREILNQQAQVQESTREQMDKYIVDTLSDLRAQGIISSKEEEDELLKFAVRIKETNLHKAADIFKEVKSAKEEAKTDKTKARQEEGSKVGTSSKASGGEQGKGVDYRTVKKMGWFDF